MIVAEVELRKDREADAVEYFTVRMRSPTSQQSGDQWLDYGEFQESRTRQMLMELGHPAKEIAEMFARARAQYQTTHP